MKRAAMLAVLLLALTGCQNDQETAQEDNEDSAPQEPTAQFVEPTTDVEPSSGEIVEYQSEQVQVIQYGSELPDTGGIVSLDK